MGYIFATLFHNFSAELCGSVKETQSPLADLKGQDSVIVAVHVNVFFMVPVNDW